MSWVTEFEPGSDHPRSSRVRSLAEPRNAREKQVPVSDGRAGRKLGLSAFAGPASTISRISISTFLATPSWCSQASPVPESRRSPSEPFMPRRSGDISSRCRPMRGDCSIRCPFRMWTTLTVCRPPSRFSSSADRRPRAPPWAVSRPYPTSCACFIPAPATIRAARRSSMPSRSHPIPRRGPVPGAMASAGSMRSPNNRWCLTTR